MGRLFAAAVRLIAVFVPLLSNARNDGADSALHHRMDNVWQKHNAPFIGMNYLPFSATLPDGRQLTNDALRGKVTVLLFWYPSCHCFDFEHMNAIHKLTAERPDFQVISLLADTADLAQFRQSHAVFGTLANLQSYRDAAELNLGNGIPSYILLDRCSIVVKVGHTYPAWNYEEEIIAKARELLMY